MERRIAVRTLNEQTSAILSDVASGQEIIVTSAGRPVARIVPIGPPSALDRLIAAGDVTAAAVKGPISIPPATGNNIDVATAMAKDREQERW
ncbi:MAG: type II toxin-antitoxin system Phd/YefM family antitoxin [Chloroflexota bacterium]